MELDAQIVSGLNAIAGSSPLAGAVTVFFASWLPYLIVGGFAAHLLYTHRSLSLAKLFPFFQALAAGLIARILIVSSIRYLLPRDRPFITLSFDPLFIVHASSFPSGHAAFFFAFSTVVFGYNRNLGIICLVLSLLVCIARIAAGVHYPSDILVGMVIGILSGLFALKYLRLRVSGSV